MSDTDWTSVLNSVRAEWDATIVPTLSEYITIPNQSPEYDPEWATNGLIEKAFKVLIDWMKAQPIKGMTHEYMEVKGKTPFLIVEIAATQPSTTASDGDTVLMYGHMDKQPPLLPWAEGLGPYTPVIRDGKLYGRGGADDGYAICAAITSVAALQKHSIPHSRIVVIIEACEESGSFDLPYYMEITKARIGSVGLMICLDSGCLNYDQAWLTTSLRGVTGGTLTVSTLSEGMHSGLAGGVVPDTFRIARDLVDRIEDVKTGEVKIPEAHCEIPAHVVESMSAMNAIPFKEQFALLPGVSTTSSDNTALALSNFWKPSLTVTGANLPDPKTAGNVIRTETSLKLSLRVPPLVDAKAATDAMARILLKDPPYGAHVTFEPEEPGNGCAAPQLQPWLSDALSEGSRLAFGKSHACQGMGGAIPFIAMLIEMFPTAQFVVTGVLGPKSNAHGPNEFLHIDYAKGITFVVSRIVAQHFRHLIKK